MNGNRTLLALCHHLRLLLQASDNTVYGIEEVLLTHLLTIEAGSNQGGLVTNVGNVGTREARRLAGQEVDIHVVSQLQRLQMYEEHLLTLVQVGQVDMYLTIESTRTQQGRVEHIGTVGSSQGDDTTVGAKAVHLSQQGIQRILTLVVATHCGILRAGTTHGVNLVDENDTWCLRLGLFKQVTDTRGTHTDKHLDEVGTRHREERHASLTSHSLCQQRLTRSRRAYQQGTLGNLTT